jgi:hypothetical protein
MHPYRKTSMRTEHPSTPSSEHPEELIVYGLLVLIGAIPVGNALIEQAPFGVEATLGVLMIGAGAIGAIAWAVQARRRPGRIIEPTATL